MLEVVIDRQKFPEPISSYINSEKVRVYEENGIITLTPILEEKPRFDHLIGMFSDGKISVDDFLEEKKQEMELEI